MSRPGIDFPGVGAGLVIMRDDGKVLLYRRLKAPEAGYWNIVGGKVDLMEPSAEAARREAEEETGLKIGQVDFLCAAEQIIAADRQHWVSLIYLTRDFTGNAALTEPDKLSDFGWFSPQEAPAPISAFAEQAFKHLST
ncbi:NUDIX domain-containing protein [Rhizobium deserti]|uniref:NUDIX domain-containing protein n=1 Tax=Rhizobium deserti TaxID=2547961 RepID=A0A4R5UII4_9HYPH|nr:NUDIX domain-containing protein [Rhizobium deserti]TDK36638.1 NUDIX domain-containing protein [Rhizobium deserti]